MPRRPRYCEIPLPHRRMLPSITALGRLKKNVIRFSVNKYHFYVACFRIVGDRYSDTNITLQPIAIPGT